VARFQLQLAGFYWATQRRDDAEKILQSLLAQEKQMPTARMGVGDFYARTGQFDKAKKTFDDGATQGGAQKNLFRLKSAMTEYAIGNKDAALAAVSGVVKEDPKNDEAVQLQASMRLASGNKDLTKSAIDDLTGVVQRNPKNPSVRYNLARAYLSRGELDAAKVQLEEIVNNISDAFLPAQTALGRVYLLKKDFGKAIQTSDTALRLNNRALEAMVVKANALMLSGNSRQARNELDLFLQRLPGNPELRFQLATLDLRDQNFNAALPVLTELHSRAPNDLRVTAALTDCLFAVNRPQEGLTLMKAEHAKNARPEVLTMLIQTAVRAKDFALAQKELEALVQKNPKEARYQLQLAEVMRLKGDRKTSLELLKQAQATDPTAVATNLQLALMLETDGTPASATPYYENALRVDPENPIILNNLAFRLAEENKDLDLALGYAQKARQRMPTNDDVSDTLGWVYIKKNLPDNAIMIYKDLLLRNPKNSIYLYHLAEALALKGERVKAREALQSALGTKPPPPEEAKIKGLLAKLT
jgi:predicted Zn-dependent protease